MENHNLIMSKYMHGFLVVFNLYKALSSNPQISYTNIIYPHAQL